MTQRSNPNSYFHRGVVIFIHHYLTLFYRNSEVIIEPMLDGTYVYTKLCVCALKIIKYSTEYIKGEPTDTLRVKVGGGDISISEGDG